MARNTPFVGRARELAAITELRKETARGPRFVLVGGEAGVGKSRLLAEFRRALPQRTIVFSVGECSDVAPAPFAPFIAMFAEFAPEIARRLSIAPPIVTPGEAATRALFDDVRRALEELAAKRALLLYLEDVHFADSGTLALLAHLARACRGPRLLAIVTYRSEALDQSDEFIATIARLVRLPNVTAIDLPPLSQRDARTLVTATVRADLAADTPFVEALVARADGNAFFLEQLVEHAAQRIADETAPLPSSISAVIRERFATLSARDRALLTHAAVLGRSFDIGLLGKVAEVEHDDLLVVLRRARDVGLVIEEPGDSQRLRFRHALTRDTIVGELLTLQRRPLHARILTVLEALPPDERDAYASELAYHALEAHDPGKALGYGEAAGDKAVRIHGYADAAYHYRHALNAGPLPGGPRRRLLLKLGDSLYLSRSAHEARHAYGEALDLARAADDVDDAGTILLRMSRQYYAHGNTSDAIAAATSAIDTLSDGGSQELRDVAAARLALYHVLRLETTDAARVLATIVRPDATDVARLYHQVRSSGFAADLNVAAWKDEAALYLAAAERDGELELAVALHNVADCAVAAGEMRLAEQWLHRSLELGRRNAAAGYLPFAASGLAYQRYLAGDLAEAKRLAESALTDIGGWAMSDTTATAAAIWAGLALGDDAFADAAYSEELVEIALASGQSQNFANVAGASADLLAERGRSGEARRLLRQALQRIEHPYACETFLFVAARHAAEGDLARVSEIACHPSRPHNHPLCAGTIALVGALIDTRRGREKQAQQHAGVAAAHFRTIGWKPFEAAALELAGQTAAATELYRAMGHVRGLRRVAAKEVHTAPSAANGPAALLSRREREIAVLVATGKANRAIAQTLGIAEKTVEQHLSSAFAKLEVSSRAQLVAALAEPTAQVHDSAT